MKRQQLHSNASTLQLRACPQHHMHIITIAKIIIDYTVVIVQ